MNCIEVCMIGKYNIVFIKGVSMNNDFKKRNKELVEKQKQMQKDFGSGYLGYGVFILLFILIVAMYFIFG